jgi:hypothetical protein
MLFMAGINTAGNQFIHFLATAERRHASILDHLYNIATVGADIKLRILHILFLH